MGTRSEDQAALVRPECRVRRVGGARFSSSSAHTHTYTLEKHVRNAPKPRAFPAGTEYLARLPSFKLFFSSSRRGRGRRQAARPSKAGLPTCHKSREDISCRLSEAGGQVSGGQNNLHHLHLIFKVEFSFKLRLFQQIHNCNP